MKTIPDQGMWCSENKTSVKTPQQANLGVVDTNFYIGSGRKSLFKEVIFELILG